MNEPYSIQETARLLAAAVRPPPGWRRDGLTFSEWLALMDGVKIEPAYLSFNAVIPDATAPGGTFTIGCNRSPEQAVERAWWYRLDQQGIAHAHAARSLTLRELRELDAGDLQAREKFIFRKRTNAASSELKRIHRIMNERFEIADGMVERAKLAQAECVKEMERA